MSSILEKIVATKRAEIAAGKAARPESALRRALNVAPAVRDFLAALAADGPIKLIGEITIKNPGRVTMATRAGSERVVMPPLGEILPRIC